jgi:Protein of unknown function (DUF2934)
MEPITVAHKVGNSPIPVFGIEASPEDEDKSCRIALLAYYKAEARGYEPGYELQDWLDAEAEIMTKTKRSK